MIHESDYKFIILNMYSEKKNSKKKFKKKIQKNSNEKISKFKQLMHESYIRILNSFMIHFIIKQIFNLN